MTTLTVTLEAVERVARDLGGAWKGDRARIEDGVAELRRIVGEAGLTVTLCVCAPNHATPEGAKACPCGKCHVPGVKP
jgi:spore germination protein YaaH